MDKSSKNASPVFSSSSPSKTKKNINLLFAQDTFDINQIQSATSINLHRDLNSSPNTSDSSAIRKIFELNSKLYLQDNQSQDAKKPPTDTSPKNSYFKLLKKLQKKNSADTLPSPSPSQFTMPLKIPISEEEPENKSNPFVTPASKTTSLLNFITKRIKPQLLQGQEEDDSEDFGFELENVLIEFPAGIISPYGYFKKCWDLLMAVMLVYICMVLPVRLCFSRTPEMFEKNRSTDFEDDWFVLDIICDVILVFDIIVNFLSAYENVAGILFSKRTDIAKKYITGWFFVDLISAFPINRNIFSLPHINFEDKQFKFDNYMAWRIIRFIKLIRVLKIFDTIEHFFSLMTLNVEKIKMIKFTTFILVFIHITGCIWNAVAELQLGLTWMDIELDNETAISEKYVTTVYFALTVLLTVGYGNIHPTGTVERLICVIWMFFGIIVYTYIFSALTISWGKLNQIKSAEEEKDMFYRQWTNTFKLPYETLDLILATIGGENSSRSARKMEVINRATKVLEDLPKGLYIDIYNYIFKELIEKVEFFRHRPRLFVIKLIPLLKQTNFEKGDFIYASGDPAMEVFFIVKGRVLSKCQDKLGKERIQVFVEGSFFGEVDIILKRTRTATLRAEDKCELWKINKKEFLALLNEFPAIKEEVEKLAKIKEIFRTPIIELTPETGTEQLANLEAITGDHLYGGSKIFNALSNKMIKKIKKGRYFNSTHNKNTYESLDFEPDLPSPDAITGQALDDQLKDLEDKEEESPNKDEPAEKEDKKASSLIDLDKGKETNPIQQVITQKRRSLNESSGIARNFIAAVTGSKPTKIKRSLVQWEINFQAKKRLLEELKLKGIEITDTSEIDKIIQKDDTLKKVKETASSKCEQVEEVGEQMLRQVEVMLAALEQYEDSVDQMIDHYASQRR